MNWRMNDSLCLCSQHGKRESGIPGTIIERSKAKVTAMGMFKPDLYRAFLIGFLIGCAGLVATMSGEVRAQVSSEIGQVL